MSRVLGSFAGTNSTTALLMWEEERPGSYLNGFTEGGVCVWKERRDGIILKSLRLPNLM